MTHDLQSTLEVSGIKWPALRNHIPCMAHVTQLALGEFMSSLGVQGLTKFWEAHRDHQQFQETETIDIEKTYSVWREANGRINQVSATRPGLVKTIEKVCISRYFESAETDLRVAKNACCIDYADTWSSKQVHRLSQSQCLHRSTTWYVIEDTLEFDTAVAWAILLITRIHPQVTPKSKIQCVPATLHNTEWMDLCEVYGGNFKAIPIMDPRDVEEAYGHITSHYQSLQWPVRPDG